jgi:hypothetical protein
VSLDYWTRCSELLHAYEQRYALARHLPWPRERVAKVDVFVILRTLLLPVLVFMAYPFPSTLSITALIATVILFVDLLCVVTAQAFVPVFPMKNPLRYVVVNLVGFVSLVPSFAIFLAPVAGSFTPTLREGSAQTQP